MTDSPSDRRLRILLIQLRYMGDVLLCTPAIRALRQAYPNATIDFLAAAPGAEALEGNPYLDERLVWRPGLREHIAMSLAIRRRRYDCVVDFQSTPRTARFVFASAAAWRLGRRGRGPRNAAYTHLVPKVTGPVYTALQKAMVLQPMRIAMPDDLHLDVVIDRGDHEWAGAMFARCGLHADRPVVAMCPVSREPYKQWGLQRWAAVGDAIAAEGAQVLITSAPDERARVEAVVRRMRHRAIWDYGRTTIQQLGAIYARCALWIGNDGGAKHVAAAAGASTLTVIRWELGPMWTDVNHHQPQLWIDAPPTQRCTRRCERCPHRDCLSEVAPGRVIDAALRLMERHTIVGHPLSAAPLSRGGSPVLVNPSATMSNQ